MLGENGTEKTPAGVRDLQVEFTLNEAEGTPTVADIVDGHRQAIDIRIMNYRDVGHV